MQSPARYGCAAPGRAFQPPQRRALFSCKGTEQHGPSWGTRSAELPLHAAPGSAALMKSRIVTLPTITGRRPSLRSECRQREIPPRRLRQRDRPRVPDRQREVSEAVCGMRTPVMPWSIPPAAGFLAPFFPVIPQCFQAFGTGRLVELTSREDQPCRIDAVLNAFLWNKLGKALGCFAELLEPRAARSPFPGHDYHAAARRRRSVQPFSRARRCIASMKCAIGSPQAS